MSACPYRSTLPGPVRRSILLHAGVADRRMWAAQTPCWPSGTGSSPRTCPVRRRSLAPAALERGRGRRLPRRPGHRGRCVRRRVLRRPRGAGGGDGPPGPGDRAGAAAARPSRVAPTAASEAFDEEEERLIEAGDVDGAVALNVDTWLGPDADDDARSLLTRMQRRAFDVQIAADESPDPPDHGPRRRRPRRHHGADDRRAGRARRRLAPGRRRAVAAASGERPWSSWAGPVTCRASSGPVRPPPSSSRPSAIRPNGVALSSRHAKAADRLRPCRDLSGHPRAGDRGREWHRRAIAARLVQSGASSSRWTGTSPA